MDRASAVRARYERDDQVARYVEAAGHGLEDAERDLVLALLRPPARLLVVGCAAGREAFGFHALGYRVAGVDLSPRLIERARSLARERGLEVPFHVGDILAPEASWGTFDALFFADSVYNYVPTRARRLACLRTVRRRLLDPGSARLIFLRVAWAVPPPRTRLGRALDRARAWAAGWRHPAAGLERGDTLVRDPLPGGGTGAPIVFHLFRDRREIRAELGESRLALVREQDGLWALRA